MKSTLVKLFALSALLLSAASSPAADPPLMVTHSVAGYTAGAAVSQIDFALRVSNPGESSLDNLTLALVPVPPFQAGTINVGTLAPHQSTTVSLQQKVRSKHSQEQVAQRELHFVGRYVDAAGTPHRFPVTSYPDGGAK